MNVTEKMRMHKIISENLFPGGRRNGKVGRRRGWGRGQFRQNSQGRPLGGGDI